MGCWLKSKTGAEFRIRDGVGKDKPMKTLSSTPVWFENLEPEAFEKDNDVKAVEGLPPPPVSSPPVEATDAPKKDPPPASSSTEVVPPPSSAVEPPPPPEPPPVKAKGKPTPSWAKDG